MSARQVTLEGGSPWGFRIQGGSDLGTPIKISRVNPGSKASLKGIREGDIISSINGTTTKDVDNSTVHKLLRNAGEQLHLSLNEDGVASPRRKLRQTASDSGEQTTPYIVRRQIVVRKYENGDENLAKNQVEVQVHSEENQKTTSSKENGKFIFKYICLYWY